MLDDPHAKLLGKGYGRYVSAETRHVIHSRAGERHGLAEFTLDLIVLHGKHLDVAVIELPKNVALSGAFGEVNLTYAQTGRVLTVTERRVGRRGVLPPERLDDLVAWLEQVSAATRESASIVLRRGP